MKQIWGKFSSVCLGQPGTDDSEAVNRNLEKWLQIALYIRMPRVFVKIQTPECYPQVF